MMLPLNQPAPSTLSPGHQQLADALAQIHGKLRVAVERSGTHFYVCCPSCLEEDGEDALSSRHLAINADKAVAGRDRVAMCMKCDTVFNVTELLGMQPLEERGYERIPGEMLIEQQRAADLYEPDGHGNVVPKGPGETIPITALPENHPAIWYLRSRNFEPAALHRQFGAEYCIKERTDMKYTRLGHGFKLSPQGRIILYIIQHGVRVGWQARQIDATDEHYRYIWNGNRNRLVCVQCCDNPEADWLPLEGWENFDPPKYITGWGTRRNASLAGFDAAVQFNRVNNIKTPFCYLVEGILDAARLGPPAIATLGKYCSETQAGLLRGAFQKFVVIPDNDAAGQVLVQTTNQWLGPTGKLTVAHLPTQFKDAGEMDVMSAKAFLCEALAGAFNLPRPGFFMSCLRGGAF